MTSTRHWSDRHSCWIAFGPARRSLSRRNCNLNSVRLWPSASWFNLRYLQHHCQPAIFSHRPLRVPLQVFNKSLTEHRNADTLNKLREAEKVLKERREQEYINMDVANEEKDKGERAAGQRWWKNYGLRILLRILLTVSVGTAAIAAAAPLRVVI